MSHKPVVLTDASLHGLAPGQADPRRTWDLDSAWFKDWASNFDRSS